MFFAILLWSLTVNSLVLFFFKNEQGQNRINIHWTSSVYLWCYCIQCFVMQHQIDRLRFRGILYKYIIFRNRIKYSWYVDKSQHFALFKIQRNHLIENSFCIKAKEKGVQFYATNQIFYAFYSFESHRKGNWVS